MVPRQVYVIALGGFAAAGALGFASLPTPVVAQPVMQNENSPLPHPRTIKSFSVGPDQALTYPKDLFSLPDMHTTFMPIPTIAPAPSSNRYLVFTSANRKPEAVWYYSTAASLDREGGQPRSRSRIRWVRWARAAAPVRSAAPPARGSTATIRRLCRRVTPPATSA
jgi:hypothetical protein